MVSFMLIATNWFLTRNTITTVAVGVVFLDFQFVDVAIRL